MIDKLMELDRKTKKRIAVVGDALIDEWIHGSLHGCQDHCPKFVETLRLTTQGGAAGAARQLEKWSCETTLFSQPVNKPIKQRFLDENNRIVFRHDLESVHTRFNEFACSNAFTEFMHGDFDAVLISDYDKGFLDPPTIRKIIDLCNERKIPVVADAKREPEVYKGAILKGNESWACKQGGIWGKQVVTHGANFPAIIGCSKPFADIPSGNTPPSRPVECRNHVGAGDCFSAHLTLALAHGLNLEAAATIAHSAGRVYVQHLHGRPPFPHEIRRDLNPVGGKTLPSCSMQALRQSTPGRIVFANGCWRIPHAGHTWLLNWAKQQGDVLVVGINDDESVEALRPNEFCLPLKERCEILAGLACVDYIVPFSEPDPCATIRALKPDLLCKGNDYASDNVPGSDLVEVRFAPESPYASHCADLVRTVKAE